jgi:antitoxin protein of toxin-antitoxin system
MGAMDNMKDKAKDVAGQHGDQVDEGIDKAGQMAKDKTGGQHDEKIDQGVDKAKEGADRLGQ